MKQRTNSQLLVYIHDFPLRISLIGIIEMRGDLLRIGSAGRTIRAAADILPVVSLQGHLVTG